LIEFDTSTYSKQQIELTESLLHSISDHLSGKGECRRQTYFVMIGRDFIHLKPRAKLLPHSSRRKSDIVDTLQHIIIEHFYDGVYAGLVDGFIVKIKPNCLVDGVYEYALSTSGKYRRWRKV